MTWTLAGTLWCCRDRSLTVAARYARTAFPSRARQQANVSGESRTSRKECPMLLSFGSCAKGGADPLVRTGREVPAQAREQRQIKERHI